jgi:hypothetical protein
MLMRKDSLRAFLLALLIGAMAAAVALPTVSTGPVLADDKGKTDKAKTPQPKEVPANCARIISATERQKCLRKSGR